MDIQTITDTQATDFPVPFSLDEFRGSILEAYLMFARQVVAVSGSMQAPADMFSPRLDSLDRLFTPDASSADQGITYDSIRHTALASGLEELYSLAYRGIARQTLDDFTIGGDHTWVGTVLLTMADSAFVHEWESFGGRGLDELRHCLTVVDTANARCVLETGMGFMLRTKGDDVEGNEGLTISQMALLSGLAEITVRAAANPKRANRLQTYSTPEGRTRVTCAAAKEWLIAKGRYIPLRYDSVSILDLGKSRFQSPDELAVALNMLIDHRSVSGDDGLVEAANRLRKRYGFAQVSCQPFVSSVPSDETPLRELAALLDIPADLLVLRAKEACLLKDLAGVQNGIKQAVGSAK